MMVLGIAVLAALYWNRNVVVDSVSFDGNNVTSAEELLSQAQVPMGISPDSLNLDEISNRIEQLHYVKHVSSYVEPSGELNFHITERKPIALLIDGDKRAYVDAEGVRLPLEDGFTHDLPLLYGFKAEVGRDTLKSTAFKQISSFLMNAQKDHFGWATISEVAYHPEEGVVALSHENGVKLVFGNNDFQIKLENWKAFYTDVIRVKGIESMQQVDLRFINQVVTRES